MHGHVDTQTSSPSCSYSFLFHRLTGVKRSTGRGKTITVANTGESQDRVLQHTSQKSEGQVAVGQLSLHHS